jgi:hypothetical protein
VVEPSPAQSQGDVSCPFFLAVKILRLPWKFVDMYQAGGATTQAFISAHEEKPSASCVELLVRIYKALWLCVSCCFAPCTLSVGIARYQMRKISVREILHFGGLPFF